LVDGRLLFAATTLDFGAELLALDSPGAYSADLGPSPASFQLTSTDPVLGSVLQVLGVGGAVGDLHFLVLSGPTAPLAEPLLFPGNESWIDLASASLLSLTSGGSLSYVQAVPSLPSLAGLGVNLQVRSLSAGQPAMTASNGLRLVLGLWGTRQARGPRGGLS
jgi:hypothetical protein